MRNTAKTDASKIHKVYLYTGEADARRQSAIDKLAARLVDPSAADFDLEKFDGNNADAGRILSAVSTAPFMSERKVVVVERVDRLAWDDQSAIAQFIPKLPERSCLILIADGEVSKRRGGSEEEKEDEGEAEETKKSGKGLKSELATAVKKNGEVVNFGKLKMDGVRLLINEAVEAQGKKIDGSAAQMLAHFMSSNPSLLDREIEKLTAYVGDRQMIRADDVEKVVSRSPEERIFGVIDAIAAGQPGQALKQLDETFASGTKPDSEALKVLAMIARQFRLLYQTRYLQNKGVRNLDAVPEELNAVLMRDPNPASVHPYVKQNLAQQARAFSLEDLEGCLRQVMECEMSMKGLGKTGGTPRLNLETLVIKLSQRKYKAG